MAGDTNANANTAPLIKVGPVGWSNDSYHNKCWDGKGHTKIARIFLSFGRDFYGGFISSLQYQYVQNGNMHISPVHGRHVGLNFETVELNAATEYIIGLSGVCADIINSTRVTSLTFETNVKKYGPFGSSQPKARPFGFHFGPGNHFGGFFGSFSSDGGDTLSSIGVYVHPDSAL